MHEKSAPLSVHTQYARLCESLKAVAEQVRDYSIKVLVSGKKDVAGGAGLTARGGQDGAGICSERRIELIH
ncbi:hypothetical protein ILYODFUR_011449 [Ilyodon furcidens]|uniref:Uncharacterized protein n=1 Tax=Ilyodon furcidens TaxID=33524 RepID=A0ABV0SMJ8_9TELE